MASFMGYGIQTSPEKSHRRTTSSSEKSASGDFFRSPMKSRLGKSPNSLKTSQKKLPAPTKNALGVLFEHYRYTAFGEPEIYSPTGAKLAASAIDNTVLWNSRRFDKDTGLYYYKYRHYKADIGRWPGRDPIEERGGINLYGFVNNEPIGRWDQLGLHTWKVRKKAGVDKFDKFTGWAGAHGWGKVRFTDTWVDSEAKSNDGGWFSVGTSSSYIIITFTCNQTTGDIESNEGDGVNHDIGSALDANTAAILKLKKTGKTATVEARAFSSADGGVTISTTAGVAGGGASAGVTISYTTSGLSIDIQKNGEWVCECECTTCNP